MNSAVTKLLSYEQAAKLDEGRLAAPEKKWALRRSVGFAVGASILLWTVIILVVRGIF